MLLKPEELQNKLNISKPTYYQYVKEGMPYELYGKKKVYDINKVRDWLNTRISSFNNSLEVGKVYRNQEIADIFKCSTQGGMRKSNTTNSLVLFCDHSKPENVYEDKWLDNVLHYTGMGQKGDQRLVGTQNKTLLYSTTNGIRVFLFETFMPTTHTFVGEVELAGEPYQVDEEDVNKERRKVYKFPLKLKSDVKALDNEYIANAEEKKNKSLYVLDENEIKLRAIFASLVNERGIKTTSYESQRPKPSSRKVTTVHYDRNPYIARYVKSLADGKCMLCEQPAPFEDELGRPYLECHHIDWLSEGGLDIIKNCSAVCSNCHAKLHVLNLSEDVKKLKAIADKYKLT